MAQTFLHNSLLSISTSLNDVSNDFRMIGNIELIDVLNDIRLQGVELTDISNDFRMKGNEILGDIISDFRMVKKELIDTLNKFNMVAPSELRDISNDIRIVRESTVYDITNVINIIGAILKDVNNDFRTQKLEIDYVNNDFRLIADFQVPGVGGFQSLGKEHIKVYIDSVEQTDIDIDSISISKTTNSSHTASFVLGRAYDSTKPVEEALVEIKYKDIWKLYKGYITNVVPGSSPDTIKINCQDLYWKNNRTEKYFFVGHEPSDAKEKYYDTISEALSSEFSWNPEIGNFVPQVMNNFSVGLSDSLTNLITNSGNYGWYYDENDNKKLWIAGQGSEIKLERQEIGKNLDLYQVLSHNFNDDVSSIINRLRVVMGNKVIRKLSDTEGNKTYSHFHYRFVDKIGVPMWDKTYEKLAKNVSSGYGFDYHPSSQNNDYKDVFKKYDLPLVDAKLESWSDRHEPTVIVWIPFSAGYICSLPLVKMKSYSFYNKMGIKEGFTIDYKNRTLTFNEPLFFYKLNSYGEVESIRRANVELYLWKKIYYSHTSSPTDNPEDPNDISSPMVFITDKMGSYPTTIFDTLELGGLSIQEGGQYQDADGTWKTIPSWDDTDFAKDIANWDLSKTCDKKILGTIEVTLDTIVQYGIDLTKRINIPGITETAMNIASMTYDLNNFTVRLELKNNRYFKRQVSLPSHGEG